MSIFDWLFGRSTFSENTSATVSEPGWEKSENGNPVIIHKSRRITVFPSDRGWKFCIAKIENDNNPFYSDVYRTEDAAKYEALAHVDRRPSKHTTFSHDSREARKAKWETHIADTENLFSHLAVAFGSVTALADLRKIERKVDSQLKHGPRHITECYRDGVSDNYILRAEKTAQDFERLKMQLSSRAAELKIPKRTLKAAP